MYFNPVDMVTNEWLHGRSFFVDKALGTGNDSLIY